MFSKSRKRTYLFNSVFSSVLMMGGVVLAEEEMVASPVTGLELQMIVQGVLNEQIEYEISATAGEHIAQQEFDQKLVNSTNDESTLWAENTFLKPHSQRERLAIMQFNKQTTQNRPNSSGARVIAPLSCEEYGTRGAR